MFPKGRFLYQTRAEDTFPILYSKASDGQVECDEQARLALGVD